MKSEIVRWYSHNPILTKADMPYPVETAHNAAAVKHGSKYMTLPLLSSHRTVHDWVGTQ